MIVIVQFSPKVSSREIIQMYLKIYEKLTCLQKYINSPTSVSCRISKFSVTTRGESLVGEGREQDRIGSWAKEEKGRDLRSGHIMQGREEKEGDEVG